MAKSDDKQYESARENHGNDPKDNGNNVATTDNVRKKQCFNSDFQLFKNGTYRCDGKSS